MSWSLYRWVWRLEAPLAIGLPPSGSLNRCRLYVPARNLWGALTAELAQRQATGFPVYVKVGADVRKDLRLTYLFPAEETARGWRAWLPWYEGGRGLVWQREDDANGEKRRSDRELRQCLLLARPGTAIDHASATAAEGTLRETECISLHWRDPATDEAKSVALVGYVFVREGAGLDRALQTIDVLFIGGDTRYGLGRVRRVAWDSASEVFGSSADLQGPDPCVTAERVLAHATVPDGRATLRGDLEALAWWDYGQLRVLPGAPVYWRPGSMMEETPRRWSIQGSGLWTADSFDEPGDADKGAGR
jgi:hypothetical protein